MFSAFIQSLFISETKELTVKDCAVVIRSMGYTKNDYAGFSKECFDGRGIHQTRIEIKAKGISINAYAYGNGESGFLNFPIVGKRTLKRFIRTNSA